MYADDHHQRVVLNQRFLSSTSVPTNNWVGGVMDWSASPQNTNTALIANSVLYPYCRNLATYRCPRDQSISAAGPRVRSYSMNSYVGGDDSAEPGEWKQFGRLTDFSKPSEIFVFVEEHPDSIDDGRFDSDPATPRTWLDLPGGNHGAISGFSFADGHAESYRWKNPSTRQPVVPRGPKPHITVPSGETGEDLTWLLYHATVKARTN
jgi:hypothetical protein